MDELTIKVTALDKPYGYVVRVEGSTDSSALELNEHFDTELAVRNRLAVIWQMWANNVDAEG